MSVFHVIRLILWLEDPQSCEPTMPREIFLLQIDHTIHDWCDAWFSLSLSTMKCYSYYIFQNRAFLYSIFNRFFKSLVFRKTWNTTITGLLLTYPWVEVEGRLLQILQCSLHEFKRMAVHTRPTWRKNNGSSTQPGLSYNSSNISPFACRYITLVSFYHWNRLYRLLKQCPN